jgi:hypothetical protein
MRSQRTRSYSFELPVRACLAAQDGRLLGRPAVDDDQGDHQPHISEPEQLLLQEARHHQRPALRPCRRAACDREAAPARAGTAGGAGTHRGHPRGHHKIMQTKPKDPPSFEGLAQIAIFPASVPSEGVALRTATNSTCLTNRASMQCVP